MQTTYNKIQSLKDAIHSAEAKGLDYNSIKDLKNQLKDAEADYQDEIDNRSPQEQARCEAWKKYYDTNDDKYKLEAIRIQDEIKLAKMMDDPAIIEAKNKKDEYESKSESIKQAMNDEDDFESDNWKNLCKEMTRLNGLKSDFEFIERKFNITL